MHDVKDLICKEIVQTFLFIHSLFELLKDFKVKC